MDGLNWYSYCGGNPVMRFDPSGLAETTIYRAISNAEFDYVMSTQKFTSTDGTMDAKFFARTYDDAVTWGNRLNGEGNFKVIEVKIDESALNDPNKFMHWEKLDSIGQACAAETEVLNKEELIISEAKNHDDNNKNDKGGGSGDSGTGINRDKPIKIADDNGRTYLLSKYGIITRYVNIDLYGVIPTRITDRSSDRQICYRVNPNALVLDIFVYKSNFNITPINPNIPNLSIPVNTPVFLI